MSNALGLPDEYYEPYDHEALTVTNGAAVGLTALKGAPAGAAAADAIKITVEGGPLRYREDGPDPDATTGALRQIGDVFPIYGRGISFFKAIATTATAAVLQVTYSRRRR
jgi:hypothetical protein